jgi:hypothetical protein
VTTIFTVAWKRCRSTAEQPAAGRDVPHLRSFRHWKCGTIDPRLCHGVSRRVRHFAGPPARSRRHSQRDELPDIDVVRGRGSRRRVARPGGLYLRRVRRLQPRQHLGVARRSTHRARLFRWWGLERRQLPQRRDVCRGRAGRCPTVPGDFHRRDLQWRL